MRVRKNQACETRDGVELAANVYLPDEEGEYPALLAFSPYGKEVQEAVLWQPRQPREETTIWDGTVEAMDMRYTTDNGYAHVVADVRGTGDSGGEYAGFFDTDGRDGYDLVEWIADQPWCTGKVGTCGRSWFGTNQLLVAAENPPHLEGVFASGIFTDLFREFAYHGGVLNMFLQGLWAGAGSDSGIVNNNWVSRTRQELGEEAFQAELDDWLEKERIKQYTNLLQLLNYPFKNPLFVDLVLNDTDNWFYAERSPHEVIDRIEVPVYLLGAWAGTHTAPTYTAWEGIESDTVKVMMCPPRLHDRPYHEYKEEMLRWFDCLLKGEDNGILEEPETKVFVSGADLWRFEEQLVPERTEWSPLYLRNHGRLLPHPEPLSGVEPSVFAQQPPAIASSVSTLSFDSEPFAEETELTGPVALTLYASIDAEDTNWMGRVRDVPPSGEPATLSRGYLRASHRALDEERSEPHAPYHPHTDPEPVPPGEVVEYAIRFPPICRVFATGHRLELELRSMEMPFEHNDELPPGSHHLPHAESITHRVYHSSEYPSNLLVPTLSGTDPDQWIAEGSVAHPGPVR
jgi:predicted acyl esterase